MARENTPHSAESLASLATQLRGLADHLDEQSQRMRQEKVRAVRVAHHASVRRGILATSRMLLEVRFKIDRTLEERRLKD